MPRKMQTNLENVRTHRALPKNQACHIVKYRSCPHPNPLPPEREKIGIRTVHGVKARKLVRTILPLMGRGRRIGRRAALSVNA